MRCLAALLAVAAAVTPPGAAQSALTAGVTVGAVQLTAQRAEQALTGVVQYQANRWLVLTAVPSLVHVSDTGSVSASGPGDLPLSAAAFHVFPAPATPAVAAALTLVLPVGDAACGLGSGTTAVGLDAGVGVSPTARLRVSADASRSVSGLSAQSILSAPHATALRAAATYDVSPGWKASASLGADVGASDSTQGLSRMVGAGVSRALAGTLAGTVGTRCDAARAARQPHAGRAHGTHGVDATHVRRRALRRNGLVARAIYHRKPVVTPRAHLQCFQRHRDAPSRDIEHQPCGATAQHRVPSALSQPHVTVVASGGPDSGPAKRSVHGSMIAPAAIPCCDLDNVAPARVYSPGKEGGFAMRRRTTRLAWIAAGLTGLAGAGAGACIVAAAGAGAG